MSIKALSWAWNQDLPTGPKFILVALADHADEEDSCFPSVRLLACRCGMADRTVRDHLRSLEADGYISTENRFVETANGRQTSNRYRVLLAGGGCEICRGGGCEICRGEGARSADREPSQGTPSRTRTLSRTRTRDGRRAVRGVEPEFGDDELTPAGATELPAPGERVEGRRVTRKRRPVSSERIDNPNSGVAMAYYLARRVRECGITEPDAVNHGAVAAMFTRWNRDGLEYAAIREMVEMFVTGYDRYRIDGKVLWQVLSTRRKQLGEDVVRAAGRREAQDHRDDVSFWTANPRRAQQ